MTRSRIVAWLRVLMPLAALALLSVLFLFGQKPAPEANIPYARVDPRDLAERQAVTHPTYAGVTGDGAELSITAAEGQPGVAGQPGRLEDVDLRLRAADGHVTLLSAGAALLQGTDLRLTDGVRMTTSDGWVLTGREFLGSTRAGTLRSDQQVTVQAPFGELTAGRMDLRPEGDGKGDHLLDLSGGVRLIYRP
ncbi:hypothetical protein [Paracoccus sp. (in: a-proteobacteria)]|uniref:hypothetical protein n=1 Tax=Paracoccus sp. TaxID=267 RepID=UPI00321FFDA9